MEVRARRAGVGEERREGREGKMREGWCGTVAG